MTHMLLAEKHTVTIRQFVSRSLRFCERSQYAASLIDLDRLAGSLYESRMPTKPTPFQFHTGKLPKYTPQQAYLEIP